MSWCCGSLCLLVLLGFGVASRIPCRFDTMQEEHKSIAGLLKLTEQVIGSNPLFSSVIKSINTSCQRNIHVMNVTLDVYIRIFSNILQSDQHQLQSDDDKSTVKSVVTLFKQKMEELRRHLVQRKDDREDVLSKLKGIKVNDPLVQRKALAEFREVYQAASVIVSPRCGHAHSSAE
ncbi:hypothetical protein VZT92_016629 [Zoarces viviparus]|uniref:Interferon gamma n=1 Tax=Zoarces viviparus TaxID=48416 RepID=A0AAW1ETA7_ZOAVI